MERSKQIVRVSVVGILVNEERRRAASKTAKVTASNLKRSVV